MESAVRGYRNLVHVASRPKSLSLERAGVESPSSRQVSRRDSGKPSKSPSRQPTPRIPDEIAVKNCMVLLKTLFLDDSVEFAGTPTSLLDDTIKLRERSRRAPPAAANRRPWHSDFPRRKIVQYFSRPHLEAMRDGTRHRE